MAHLVEHMAYTNEVPWHGLGFHVDGNMTPAQMLKAAKLDWRVDRQDMHLADGTKVKDFAALVRSSDNSVLDVVGSRYIPTQNEDVFSFFKEFVEAGGATMETAGSLRNGKHVWGLAKLNAGFKMRGNDQVNGYLLAASPHEQGKSLVIKFTTVRVVCNNTITLALRGKSANEFRMNHRNEFNTDMMSKAKDVLGIAREQLGEFEENARKLQKTKMSRKDAIDILQPYFQASVEAKDLIADFEKASPRMQTIMDILERAPGAQPDNAWGVLNAVTYYTDHVASRSADRRLTNAWLGKTANMKEAVLADLLELAA